MDGNIKRGVEREERVVGRKEGEEKIYSINPFNHGLRSG